MSAAGAASVPGSGTVATRCLIADDQAMVREGFAAVLAAQSDLEVVGQAADGAAAVLLARELSPDLVLMDVRMPVMDGLQATREILRSPEHLRLAFEARHQVVGAPAPWRQHRPARCEGVEEPVPRHVDVHSSAEVRAKPPHATANRTPAQVLREARTRDSETKRARALKTLNEMAATGEKITFLGLARTARVSNWLVYAEGLREHIEEAIKKQSGAAQREAEAGSRTSAESLAADLELAMAELRILRAERDRLKAGMAQLRETEAERDRLREALKETEEKLEFTLKESRSSSSHRAEK